MRIAQSFGSSFPRHRNDEELVASALFGLFQAAKSYDPKRGVPFMSHAFVRIRGAIVDDMRAMTWGPRSDRSALPQRRMVQCSTDRSVPCATTTDDDDAFERLLGPLNGRVRFVMRSHFRDGYTQRETGELLGLTESRVNQILKKAYPLVRAFLDGRERDHLVDERHRDDAVRRAAVE